MLIRSYLGGKGGYFISIGTIHGPFEFYNRSTRATAARLPIY